VRDGGALGEFEPSVLHGKQRGVEHVALLGVFDGQLDARSIEATAATPSITARWQLRLELSESTVSDPRTASAAQEVFEEQLGVSWPSGLSSSARTAENRPGRCLPSVR